MPPFNRRRLVALAAGALALPLTRGARAQTRPELATILVPFPAGGTTDMVARLLADQLRGDLAETVVVDNRTGAGGRLAIQALKQAPAEGLTLLVHAGGIQSLYPHVIKNLGYEPWADVTPVSTLCRVETCLAVGPGAPASIKTLQDYLAWARTDPLNRTFASAGAGTPGHLLISVLGQLGKVELVPVHYRSGSAAFPDLLGGQVAAIGATLNDAVGQLPSGRIRILASSGERRSALTPDVPTFGELGFPQLVNVDHFEVFVHGKTSPAVQERLSAAVRKALTAPALVAGMKKVFVEPVGSTPADSVRQARLAFDTNARLIKAVSYQPE